MKSLIRKILKEQKEDFYKKLSKVINRPYFNDLESIGIKDQREIKKVMQYVFDPSEKYLTDGDFEVVLGGSPSYVSGEHGVIYEEHWSSNDYEYWEHHPNGNVKYHEMGEGYGVWEKSYYDETEKLISFEDSDGYWVKMKWGNIPGEWIEYEDSMGRVTPPDAILKNPNPLVRGRNTVGYS